MKRFDMNGKKRSFFAILTFGAIFYSFSLFSTSIVEISESKSRCSILEDWFNFVNLMSFIDTITTMIVPFLLILVINILIVCKLVGNKPFKRVISFNKPKSEASKLLEKRANLLISIDNKSRSSSSQVIKSNKFELTINSSLNQSRKYSRTTKMLLTLSVTFLLLNTPMAFNKIVYFIKYSTLFDSKAQNQTHSMNATASRSSLERSTNEEILERLACYLYYLQFSLNFFLYAFNGSKFKKILFKVTTKKS
jgi:hypothetical protein